MGLDFPPALTMFVALVPAAHVWWRNRCLARLLDDPALPERVMAERVRMRAVLAVSLALLFITGFHRLVWSVPMLIIARIAAAYPFSKLLFEETWGFGAYLSFYLRLCVALFGWLLVAFLPALTGFGSSHEWIDAVLFGAISAVWVTWFSTIFRKILGSTPVSAPALVSRFEQLRNACGLPHVDLEIVTMRGGVLANAVALASLTGRAVVMTDTLAERLDEDEVHAILAHELAHHEHYTRSLLIKRLAGSYTLIATGVFLSPALHAFAPQAMLLGTVMWMLAVMVGLGLQLQHSQKHETESDLRAVALTGNPEALVRALTKLNAIARLPRRWASDFERRATHPSLARRIQAIRAASSVGAAGIETTTAFTDVNGTAAITFGKDRLDWSEGGAAVHQFPYDSLSELRIDAGPASAPRLIAVDLKNRRWEFAIAPGDVAPAQAILDVVDGRLQKPVARVEPPALLNPTRVLAWLSIAFGIGAGYLAVAIPALLAIIRPASQLAGATGAAILTAAFLTWRDRTASMFADLQIWTAVILAVCGVALLVFSFLNRRDQLESRTETFLTIIPICASVAWAIVMLSGMAGIDLYRNLHARPSVPVLTAACAGAVAFANSRTDRLALLLATALGALALFIGSTAFANNFVTDSFIAPAPAITVRPVTAMQVGERSMAFDPSMIWISPNGTHIAASSEDEQENVTIHAGPISGRLDELTADGAAFVSDNRLLLLEHETRGSMLRLVDLDASARELWSLHLPLRFTGLSVDRASERWRLLGLDEAGRIASAEGRIGDPVVRHAVWPASREKGANARPISAGRGTVLALDSRPLSSPLEHIAPRSLFFQMNYRVETRLWSLTGREFSTLAASRADVNCRASAVIDDAAICEGFDGVSTRFFSIDPTTGRLVAVASTEGRFLAQGGLDRGWLSGWLNSVPVLLHPTTAEAVRMPASLAVPVYQLAMGETVFAALSWENRAFTLRIFSKPQISN